MAELTDDIVRRGLTDHLITEFPTFFKYSRNLQKIKHFKKLKFLWKTNKNKRILRKMNQLSNKRMKLKVYKNPKNVGISGSADVTCPQTNYTHRCYQKYHR